MQSFEELGLEIGHFIAPVFVLAFAAVFAAFWWSTAQSVVVWIRMKSAGYHEREEVYLNGSRAVIAKLGFFSTSFLILNGGGVIMRWAVVSNQRLDMQRIERVSLQTGKLDHWEPDKSYPCEHDKKE